MDPVPGHGSVRSPLAWLTLSHRINIKEVLALSAMQGIINAFDMPGRQSFMIRMVEDRTDLSNAIAINSSMVNAARLLGPSLAGLVIAATNEGWCFLIDGVSYIAVIASLVMMRVAHDAPPQQGVTMVEQLRQGWMYVAESLPIRSILLLFALISLMGWPFMVLMPIFAAQVLHGGPHTFGFLMGAVGVGSLVSALALVVRRSVRGLLKIIPIGAAVFGVGLVAFGFSRSQWLSIPLMFVTGFGMMQGVTTSNTILQTLVDEKMRGRVMSYYTMAFVGMAPFGSLLAGALAHAIGAPRTVIISGIACLAGSLWFWSRMRGFGPRMRPIYPAPRHRSRRRRSNTLGKAGKGRPQPPKGERRLRMRWFPMGLTEDLDRISLQERELQLPRFDAETAWELGSRLRALAAGRGFAVVIDVRRFGQPLFYTALEGTKPDHPDWVRRKSNVVARFLSSSYILGLREKLKKLKPWPKARAFRLPITPRTEDRFPSPYAAPASSAA